MAATIIFSLLIVLLVVTVTLLCVSGSIVAVLPVTHGAMFHPTARVRIATLLDHLPMKEGELFIDLGCGTGRVLTAAVRRYGVRALGFEINPLAYAIARLTALRNDRVEIRWQNFWKADLSGATVVFCYLFPDVMGQVAMKLERELRPGSRVASGNFPLPGWQEETILYPPSRLYGDPIYLYSVPTKAAHPA